MSAPTPAQVREYGVLGIGRESERQAYRRRVVRERLLAEGARR